METMSPQDASFLHTEDAVTHMHIGSVGIFDGPALAPDEVPAAVARQLPLGPRYRQKVRFVPLDLGRLIRAGDPHFSLGYHARRTALLSPAGGPELGNLVGRVMSQQLDRPKPLWEIRVAEGLDEGRSALLDRSREPEPPAADPWRPQRAPSPAELVAHALALRAASPYEGIRTALAALRGWDASQALEALRGLSSLRRLAQAPPPSSLNGPIGPHRRWGLDPLAALRRAASPTSSPKRPARATPKPAGRERSRAVRPRVADVSSGEGQDAANVAESPAAYVYAGLRANGDYYYSVTIPSLIVAAYGGGNGLATQRECLEMVGCYVAGKVRKFAGILAAAVLCGVLSLGSAIIAEEWVQAHDLYGRDRP